MTTLWRYCEAYQSTDNRPLQSDWFFLILQKMKMKHLFPRTQNYEIYEPFLSINTSKIFKRHNSM